MESSPAIGSVLAVARGLAASCRPPLGLRRLRRRAARGRGQGRTSRAERRAGLVKIKAGLPGLGLIETGNNMYAVHNATIIHKIIHS